jgi:transcriptional regulator
MSKRRTEIPYGTLEILILKTLDILGPLHGYRLARRIEQVAEGTLRLSQGAIYPVLVRLEQEGWIRTRWELSETNRQVKSYELTSSGRRQLATAVAQWQRANALVAKFLESEP